MRRLLTLLLLLLVAAPVAAQGTLAPNPKFTAFTNAGAPCASCLLYAYQAGTTTALDTYSDVALTSANTNPVVLDSSGRATIFLGPAAYKFVLKTSAGSTIWTQDNVYALSPFFANLDVTGTAGEALSAGNAVYLSDGSGGKTAGRWYLTDADNTYSSSTAGLVGIAPAAISSGASGSIRLQGRITGLTSLSVGSSYYVSATAGAITTTAPSNARVVGLADSTTSLVAAPNQAQPAGNFTIGGNLAVGGNTTLGDATSDTVTVTGRLLNSSLRVADSDNTHALVITPGSNLTADRILTVTTGDAARTLTISGNATLDQDVSTTATPTFGSALVFGSSPTVRRNTADGADSGYIQIAGGGSGSSSRGSYLQVAGNENATAGDLRFFVGNGGGAYRFYQTDETTSAMALTASGALTTAAGITATTGNLTLSAASGGVLERGRAVAMGVGQDVAFSAGDYTASGTMTITVGSGDVAANRWSIVGKTVTWILNVSNIDLGGSASNEIRVAIPNSMTAVTAQGGACNTYSNGAEALGKWEMASSGTYIKFFREDKTNYTTGTDVASVRCNVVFEVN